MEKISLKEDAISALKEYEKLEPYRIQEMLLRTLVDVHPGHTNRAAVETKVKLLNLFYSTGIQAVNKMTDNIFGIKDIAIMNLNCHFVLHKNVLNGLIITYFLNIQQKNMFL